VVVRLLVADLILIRRQAIRLGVRPAVEDLILQDIMPEPAGPLAIRHMVRVQEECRVALELPRRPPTM